MSVIGQLHQLEEIELSLAESCRILEGVKAALLDHSAVTRIEAELESQRQRLTKVERARRDAEAEGQDLEVKITTIRSKIDGGSVRNPKELVNLDRELHLLEAQLREKDGTTLTAMDQVDELRRAVEQENVKLTQAQESFARRKIELEAQQGEVEKQVAVLEEQRQKLVAGIAPDKLELYKMLREQLKNGRVVVGVERGFCLGCRIALPVNEMRNLERGNIVRCSTCGRILYMA